MILICHTAEINHIQDAYQRKTKEHRRIQQDLVYRSLKRQQALHGHMIFKPNSANKTQNPQTRKKETAKCIVAIPGFLKAWSASHTFLYSQTSKTPASLLFHMLCFRSHSQLVSFLALKNYAPLGCLALQDSQKISPNCLRFSLTTQKKYLLLLFSVCLSKPTKKKSSN